MNPDDRFIEPDYDTLKTTGVFIVLLILLFGPIAIHFIFGI